MSDIFVKALSTLSGNIMGLHTLNDLLEGMLCYVGDYAKPDTLYFIMERKGRLFIVGSLDNRNHGELAIRGRAVENSKEINFALATEIAVAKRRQVYDNSLDEMRLAKYRVHQNYKRVAVIGEPLVCDGKLLGYFYLEYFDRGYHPETLTFFDLVTPGLSIAMHNTLRFIESKREQEALRLKLEKASKPVPTDHLEAAEMTHEEALERAKAASYVLHKLGNVLNAALMLGEEMEEMVEEMPPMEKLVSVQALLDENRSNLTKFILEDERGQKIPKFLLAASEKLGKEREEFFEEMKNLNSLLSEMRELMLYHQDKVNKME